MNTRSRRKPVDLGDDERLKSQCSECGTFKEVLQDLRREIADKKAEVVTLKNQQLLQNKPFEETIKRLESQIARFKDEVSVPFLIRFKHMTILTILIQFCCIVFVLEFIT